MFLAARRQLYLSHQHAIVTLNSHFALLLANQLNPLFPILMPRFLFAVPPPILQVQLFPQLIECFRLKWIQANHYNRL
jgi:hypothetical protein